MFSSLHYHLALAHVKSLKDAMKCQLAQKLGGVETIFTQESEALLRASEWNEKIVLDLFDPSHLEFAESEIQLAETLGIRIIPFESEEYPYRLKHCTDPPMVLYAKNTAFLNTQRILAIVGTREATPYGHQWLGDFMEEIKDTGILVVSGLAHGIDTWAHEFALNANLPTVSVLGNGLDSIYPAANRGLAAKILQSPSGGLLSEQPIHMLPSRQNFPKRNRIIAGMSDALLMVEAKARGGALISAHLASDFNREVFAVPGSTFSSSSAGCNGLIAQNKAQLVTHASDILKHMEWDKQTDKAEIQDLFSNQSTEERSILQLLLQEPRDIHFIIDATKWSASRASRVLMQLEIEGKIRAMPGNKYRKK